MNQRTASKQFKLQGRKGLGQSKIEKWINRALAKKAKKSPRCLRCGAGPEWIE